MANYFTRGELILYAGSLLMIILPFFALGCDNYLSLFASIIGVTSLIFIAKGNPLGQGLTILFSIFYGIISYGFTYYGEMITYLCMTAPMAALALWSWLKNPYEGKRSEVRVNRLGAGEYFFMAVLTGLITFAFYFILSAFETANIIPSTISVATSFSAVYLTFRRSPYYALAYAANDIVLIVLWVLASLDDVSYISVVFCFAAFFMNDIYGFLNWRRMEMRQRAGN